MERHIEKPDVAGRRACISCPGLAVHVRNEYYLHLAILILLWTALGAAWNLLGGYTGQVSFGHSAFFGMGAYVSLLLHTSWEFPFGWASSMRDRRLAHCHPDRLDLFSVARPVLFPLDPGLFRGPAAHRPALEEVTEGAVGILLIQSILDSKISFYYLMLVVTVITCWSSTSSSNGSWGSISSPSAMMKKRQRHWASIRPVIRFTPS